MKQAAVNRAEGLLSAYHEMVGDYGQDHATAVSDMVGDLLHLLAVWAEFYQEDVPHVIDSVLAKSKSYFYEECKESDTSHNSNT